MKYIARFVSVVAFAASAAASHAGNGLPPQGGMLPKPPFPPMQGGGSQNGGPQPGGGPFQGGPQQGPGGGIQNGGPSQGPGQHSNVPPSAPKAHQVAMLLAMSADADKSGDVTADEWAAFLATLNADADGVVDLAALESALPPHPRNAPAGVDAATLLTRLFDKDQDGVVTLADLNAFFALLDADGDGALASGEMAPPHGGPGGDQDCKGGPHGLGGAPDAWKAAMLLARAADADASGDVDAAEWASLLASLGADEDGVVDPAALAAALPTPPNRGNGNMAKPIARLFDRDKSGAVDLDDLDAYFAVLDKDGDGALSHEELAPLPRFRGAVHRAANALFRAADADADREVSSDEWTAFLDGLVVDDAGVVSLDDFAGKLPVPPRGWPEDAADRDALLVHAFDYDKDGVVTTTDLQSVFDLYDRNADAVLKRAEARRPR